MSGRKPSVCWKLFTLKGDQKTAVCDICKLELRYSCNSTTNFMRHLRNKHPFELQSYEEHASTSSGRVGNVSSATSSTSTTTLASASSIPTDVSRASTSSSGDAPQAATLSASTTAVPSTQRGATSAHPAATKQMTMESVIERTIKYKPGSARKKEIDACILKLITTDLQPLSVVENSFPPTAAQNGSKVHNCFKKTYDIQSPPRTVQQ
ncbi:hypothetical protein RRG08_058439 [Elysia crispata]|uniref:BED-type domain-containing protein n=1 Tax=Elysia crispata TaxID=231223 RepID=A0AAE0XZX9_9GAST|nr:hypothetical protein RRG08_058439 [Elysia crispata]